MSKLQPNIGDPVSMRMPDNTRLRGRVTAIYPLFGDHVAIDARTPKGHTYFSTFWIPVWSVNG